MRRENVLCIMLHAVGKEDSLGGQSRKKVSSLSRRISRCSRQGGQSRKMVSSEGGSTEEERKHGRE